MSGAESLWHTTGTLLQDFQSGFSAMMHRCPPIQLPFMISWIAASARIPSAAALLSALFLISTVFFSLLSNHTGRVLSSAINMFAARHAAFFHVTAGIFTLLAVYQYSGLASPSASDIRHNFLKSAFLCLFWGAYFVFLENITCTQCPLFFARILHPPGTEQTFLPILRIVFYKTGHGAFPLLIAVLLTLILHTQKLKHLQPSACFIFSLPLVFFGFFFFFIA